MTVDLDALIAEAREWPRDGVNEGPLINALADALESTRDTGHRIYADALAEAEGLRAALSRAEETIEKIARFVGSPGGKGAWLSGHFPDGIRAILTEYGKQKAGLS